jgi:predicted transcriptional regulator
MTVKEIAEAVGKTERSVRNWVQKVLAEKISVRNKVLDEKISLRKEVLTGEMPVRNEVLDDKM